MEEKVMRKPLTTVLFAAVAAAAVSVAAIALAFGGGGDVPKQAATDALKPSELTKVPPGQQVRQDITTPVTYGQFRILPAGSVPTTCGVPHGSNDVKITESKDLTALNGLALNPVPAYMPAGWSVSEVHIERTLMDDGIRRETNVSVEYARPRQFPILITRMVIDPSCVVETVEDEPGGNETNTLTELRGVKAVVTHQTRGAQVPLVVKFVQDSTLTVVQAVAIDMDDLLRIAESLVEAK